MPQTFIIPEEPIKNSEQRFYTMNEVTSKTPDQLYQENEIAKRQNSINFVEHLIEQSRENRPGYLNSNYQKQVAEEFQAGGLGTYQEGELYYKQSIKNSPEYRKIDSGITKYTNVAPVTKVTPTVILPTYTDSLGQGISVDQNLLQQNINNAINTGDIQGFSGKVLTDQQVAKQNLLINAGFIKPKDKVEQYGETYIPVTQKGQDLLTKYKQTLPISQILPKPYEDANLYKSYPVGLESGMIDPYLNIGSPLTISRKEMQFIDLKNHETHLIYGNLNSKNPKITSGSIDFKDLWNDYKKNIQTSSNDQALQLALIGLPVAKGLTLVNPIPIAKKFLSTTGGKLFTAGLITSPVISPAIEYADKRFLYQPTSKIGRFGKSAVEGAVIGGNPFLAGVFLEKLGKSVITSPYSTAESMLINYPETLGFIAGGGLKVEGKLPKYEIGKIEGVKSNFEFGKDIKAELLNYEKGYLKVSYEVPFKKTRDMIWTQTVDRALGNYKKLETNALGERTIKGAKGTTENFDIGIIPERGAELKINTDLINSKDIFQKENPTINELNSFQKSVLDVVKKQNDVIGGSFAGKILFEGARKPGDIDIVARNPIETANLIRDSMQREILKSQINDITLIKEKLEGVKISPHKVNNIDVVTIEDAFGNKADIVSIKGYKSVRKLLGFGDLKTINVEGFRLIRPEDLLHKKLEALKDFGLENEKTAKTIEDIKTYTKGKLNADLNKATISGAYGHEKILEKYIGKKINVAHSSTGFFSLFKNEKELMQTPEQLNASGRFTDFFGTPADLKTGLTQTRVTRLGMEASIKDFLTGDVTFEKSVSKPQIIVFENQKIGIDLNKVQYGKEFNILKKSSELEVGLPVESKPGVPNLIRRKSSAGVTLIEGNRVKLQIGEIVSGDRILTKDTLNLLERARENKLSESQIKELNKKIFEETGVDYSGVNKPYFDLNRIYSKSIRLAQESMISNIKSSIDKRFSLKAILNKSNVSKVSNNSISNSGFSVLSKSDISSYNNISSNLSNISNNSNTSNKSNLSNISSNKINQSSKSSISSIGSNSSRSSRSSSSILSSNDIKKLNNPIFFNQERRIENKKSLGTGYNVYGKQLKSNKFFKINSSPVTRGRALDIGSYYVSNTLARSYKVSKSSSKAEEDYQFSFIPVDYHLQVSGQIREFRIKNRQPIDIGEIYIQKNPYLLNTPGEKRQIKNFRNQVKSILR